jgi:ubiquinone/menaquinone biosynthesis C-methylase UbiE
MSQSEHVGEPPNGRSPAAQEAESRGRLTELRQQLYGGATQQMLQAAQLEPGDRVLDIAAGTGDQSREAARLVGPTGSVLATDISQEMLDVAARFARQEGLSNIATRAMNAEQLDLADQSFDAVISRFGLMLIPRKQQALAEIRRVLKPEGMLAALVWSKPERNPLFVLADTLLAQSFEEQPTESDAFSLADAALFARMLAAAGFSQVQVEAIALTFHFPTFEVLADWWGPSFDKTLAKLEPESRQRVLEEARQAVRQFAGPQGILAPAELLLGAGMN